MPTVNELVDKAYELGFIHGLKCCAHWKDGVEEVGTCGTTFRDAVKEVRSMWNFDPPKIEEKE